MHACEFIFWSIYFQICVWSVPLYISNIAISLLIISLKNKKSWLNMLIQDTFISIIRFVFNILILICMHVIKKWILYKGQKSKTLRHCSKYAHTWELFKNLYEKLQNDFLDSLPIYEKNVSKYSNQHNCYYICTWNRNFWRFRHKKMKITALGFRLFRPSPM